MGAARARARAKINLSLRVLAREQSGYHQIETIFCALDLADDIAIETAPGDVALHVIHAGHSAPDDIGSPERNLAVRAALLFARSAGIPGGMRIQLTKRIPAGAGLGGGSSDAAAVLRILSTLYADALSAGDLLALAGELGSDVPFFVTGADLALAWGRGERILPLPPLPPRPVVLAIPPERVRTEEAYAALDPDRGARPGRIDAPVGWADIAAAGGNDFEPVIFARHPRLREIRDQLAGAGALIARMTGSGSVLFGVFEDAADAARAAGTIAERNDGVATLLTRTA